MLQAFSEVDRVRENKKVAQTNVPMLEDLVEDLFCIKFSSDVDCAILAASKTVT